MPQKIIVLRGLPASGKSTWAREFIASRLGKESWKRINKDDLRAMLDDGKFSKEREAFILKVRDELADLALKHGHNVIIDDTNFPERHFARMQEIAFRYEAECELKVFDTPLAECLKRDAQRVNSVGKKVIMRMYNDFIRAKEPKPTPPAYDPAKRDCIVVDVDGTVALHTTRGPFEWHRVKEDEPNTTVLDLIARLMFVGATAYSPTRYWKLIFVSGRDGCCEGDTLDWLTKHVPHTFDLYMRAPGDSRKDAEVKREIYEMHIAPNYNVRFVFDDRNQTVEMWRSLGLTCLQVAPGDF